MIRFMLVTFAFLGWAFYEMSGGADFDPERARLDNARTDPLQPADAQVDSGQVDTGAAAHSENAEVTRISLDLTSVEDVLNRPDPAGEGARATEQPAQPRPAVAEAPPGNEIEIIPSLVENATPEAETDDTIPSLVEGATSATVITAESASVDTVSDIRFVTGSRVNMRGGPGTNYGVVATLVQGDRVEVLDDSGTGWVRLRATDGGTMGWMAASLLSDG